MQALHRLMLQQFFWGFVIVGTIFFLFPDGTVRFMNAAGHALGDFAPLPPSEGLRFWLSLGTAYMALVSALAWLLLRDLARYRHLLPILALGKAVSSLTCLGYYWFSADAFLYLANFLVDGSIALGCLWIYAGTASLEEGGLALSTAEDEILRAALEGALPGGGPSERSVSQEEVARLVRSFAAQAGVPLGAALRLLDLSPFFVPPFRLRRFTRLPLAERVRLLEAHESSAFPPRRLAAHAFKQVVMLGFYSRPDVEAALGYASPLERVPR